MCKEMEALCNEREIEVKESTARAMAEDGLSVDRIARILKVETMCREMEEIRNEGLTEGELERARQIAIRLSKSKMSIEEIADTVGESVQFVKSWLSKSVAPTCQEKN